jgi:acetyl esterase
LFKPPQKKKTPGPPADGRGDKKFRKKIKYLEKELIDSGLDEILQNFKNCGLKSSASYTLQERRNGYIESNSLAGEKVEIATIQDTEIEETRVRYYQDTKSENPSLCIYFHGGCFISGGIETHDKQMRILASKTDAKICFIDYRIAPEFKYPIAHDDCLKVTRVLLEELKVGKCNYKKIILAGDSAGGNIALSVGLTLKEDYGNLIDQIILLYPMLDPYGNSKSMIDNGNDYVMTSDAFLSGYDIYLNSEKEKEDIRINLLKRNDFKGLPETHIITGELDPLRDEGEDLYKKLRDCEVEAYCTRYIGVFHGFSQLNGISKTANKSIAETVFIINEL